MISDPSGDKPRDDRRAYHLIALDDELAGCGVESIEMVEALKAELRRVERNLLMRREARAA